MEVRPRIFISYARSDGEGFARDLRGRLQEEGFSLWQDRTEMEGGKDWWRQIEDALRVVEYMVLVLTPAALRSDIVVKEWRLARQLGVCVIPVFGAPNLDLSSLPRWMRQTHVVSTDIPDEWTRLVRTLQGPCTTPRVPFMAPDLPADFVARPREFDELVRLLLESRCDRPVAITAALRGAGGYGKTTLAAALCHDERIQEEFHDGILWMTIGREPGDLTSKVTDLIETLTGERPGFQDVGAAAARLAEVLGDRDLLLVLDDVWRAGDLQPFLRGGRRTVRLLTTRIAETLPQGSRAVPVDAMGSSEAVQLLGWGLDVDAARLQALAARLGEWPLLLKLVNGALRSRVQRGESVAQALAYAERVLQERGLTGFDAQNANDRNQAVEVSVGLSLELLTEAENARFAELAVFPEDVDVPLETVATLWQATSRWSELVAEEACVRLHDLSLLARLDLAQRTLRLHDVMRGYLRGKHQASLAGWNGRFLEAARPPAGWFQLPPKERYLWRHVAWHLKEAGREVELRSLLADFRWLEAKLRAVDAAGLAADCDLLAGDEEMGRLGATLRLAAHVLARRPEELPGQLLGRIARPASSALEALLDQAAAWRGRAWLKPLRASLTPPGGPLLTTLEGHSGSVWAVAVTPDGRRAVSGSEDGTLKVWDLETGGELAKLRGHSGRVSAVALTPDGSRAVSGSHDRTLKVWDLETGAAVATLEGHSEWVRAVAVTPDGRRAVSGSSDNTLKVWDLETGAALATLEGHSGAVRAVAVTPDGRRAVSGSHDRTLMVWDLETGTALATLEGHADWVRAVAVTLDGRRAVSGSDDRTLKVWDLETDTARATLKGHSNGVTAVAVTLDGRRAVSGSDDHTLKVWDLETGAELTTLTGHSDRVRAVAVTADGRRAVSGADDHTLKVWDLETDTARATLEGPSRPVLAVAVTHNGRRAVSGADDCTLKVWDLETGDELATLKGPLWQATAVAVTANGRRAVFGAGQEVIEWDLKTAASSRRCNHWWLGSEFFGNGTLGHHSSPVTAVAVTPDGRRAVSGSHDGTLKVWNLKTGGELAALKGHSRPVTAVAVTPDGRRAVSGSRDGTLKVWNLETGAKLAPLEGHRSSVAAVAVTPDGWRAVSGTEDGTLKVWGLKTGAELATLEGHAGWVRAVAVTPNGRCAVSGSNDRTLRVWDLETGAPVAVYTADASVTCCAVAPDGVHILAGDALGRMHFLELIE